RDGDLDGRPADEARRRRRRVMTTLSAQRYFEDVSVGDEFEEAQHPTPEHVAAFIATGRVGNGNNDPGAGRFSNVAEARRQGLESPIGPGAMSTSIITRVVTDWMGPLGRIVSLDISFRRPVIQGDHLRCLAVVTDTGDEGLEFGGPAIVRLDVTLENERGEQP